MLRFLGIALMAVSCCPAQDEKPAPTIPDLIQTAQASYMHGDYEGARQSLLKAWDLAQLTPPEDPVRYDVLKRLSTARAAVGEFADADNYLQLAISWRETNLGMNDAKIPDDVLLSVAYCRGMKDYERALQIMNRVVRLHVNANIGAGAVPGDAMSSISVADDFSRIAQIQAELKKIDDAIGTLNMALGIRTKLLGPLDPSLVYDLDRLGGLQITQRAYDKAEETYRHALVIRETLYGKVHADLISTVDGLGYSLFGQKKYDEAEPVYQRLLGLWISSVGGEETHPMVAVALDKIAVFYATQKKWDQADDATTRANAIRAFVLADGLSGEASQRIDEGKLADAVPIYQRALDLLGVPGPISDDMLLTKAVNEQRATLAGMLIELQKVVKKPPSKAPAITKK
jgi:tetratricopeptide (TPR) repeat protein